MVDQLFRALCEAVTARQLGVDLECRLVDPARVDPE